MIIKDPALLIQPVLTCWYPIASDREPHNQILIHTLS